MDDQEIVRRARTLYLLGLAACLAATVLATLSAQSGRWDLWGANAALFLAAGACVVVNVCRAARHSK